MCDSIVYNLSRNFDRNIDIVGFSWRGLAAQALASKLCTLPVALHDFLSFHEYKLASARQGSLTMLHFYPRSLGSCAREHAMHLLAAHYAKQAGFFGSGGSLARAKRLFLLFRCTHTSFGTVYIHGYVYTTFIICIAQMYHANVLYERHIGDVAMTGQAQANTTKSNAATTEDAASAGMAVLASDVCSAHSVELLRQRLLKVACVETRLFKNICKRVSAFFYGLYGCACFLYTRYCQQQLHRLVTYLAAIRVCATVSALRCGVSDA